MEDRLPGGGLPPISRQRIVHTSGLDHPPLRRVLAGRPARRSTNDRSGRGAPVCKARCWLPSPRSCRLGVVVRTSQSTIAAGHAPAEQWRPSSMPWIFLSAPDVGELRAFDDGWIAPAALTSTPSNERSPGWSDGRAPLPSPVGRPPCIWHCCTWCDHRAGKWSRRTRGLVWTIQARSRSVTNTSSMSAV
jgi:hypothetical protein